MEEQTYDEIPPGTPPPAEENPDYSSTDTTDTIGEMLEILHQMKGRMELRFNMVDKHQQTIDIRLESLDQRLGTLEALQNLGPERMNDPLGHFTGISGEEQP